MLILGSDQVLCPGTACGNGLTEKAAEDLGLRPGLPVATSMIDAYAGALGECLCCCLMFYYLRLKGLIGLCGISTMKWLYQVQH